MLCKLSLAQMVPVAQLPHENPVTYIQDSRDGSLIITGDGITAKIWEGKYGQLVKTIPALFVTITSQNKLITFQKYSESKSLVQLLSIPGLSVEKEVLLNGRFEQLIWTRDSTIALVYGGRSNFTNNTSNLINIEDLTTLLTFNANDVRLDYDDNKLVVVNYLDNKYSCSYMNFKGEVLWETSLPKKHISCCSDATMFGIIEEVIFFNENEQLYTLDKNSGKKSTTKKTYFDLLKKIPYSSTTGFARIDKDHYFFRNHHLFSLVSFNDETPHIQSNQEGWPENFTFYDGIQMESVRLTGNIVHAINYKNKRIRIDFSDKTFMKDWREMECLHINETAGRYYAGYGNGSFEIFDQDWNKILAPPSLGAGGQAIHQAAINPSKMYLYTTDNNTLRGRRYALDLGTLKLDLTGDQTWPHNPVLFLNSENYRLFAPEIDDDLLLVRHGKDSIIPATFLGLNADHSKMLLKGKKEWSVVDLNNFEQVKLDLPMPRIYESYKGNLSPDGKTILFFYQDEYYVYSVEDGLLQKIKSDLPLHESHWNASSDYFLITWTKEITSLKDKIERKALLFNKKGELLTEFPHGVYWTNHGKYLITFQDGKIISMSPDGKEVLGTHPLTDYHSFFVDDERYLLNTGDSLIPHRLPGFTREPWAIKYNSKGLGLLLSDKKIITLNGREHLAIIKDDSVAYYEMQAGKLVKTLPIPDGSWSAYNLNDRYLMLYDNIFDGGFIKIDHQDFSVTKFGNGEMPLLSDYNLLNEYRDLYSTSLSVREPYRTSPERIKDRLLSESDEAMLNSINPDYLPAIDDQGLLKIYNLHNDSLLFTVMVDEDGYLITNADNYYAKCAGFKNMRFVKDMDVFSFEQFDLKYNRPDIILKELGKADEQTISSFHHAYLKRLKRMGFTEDMLKEDFHIPEIEVINKESLQPITDTSVLNLQLKINDSKYPLDRINVFINDVPLYGSDGISLRSKQVKSASENIEMILAEGENKVQVSVLNQAGAESVKETIYINYKPTIKRKHDLYIVAIGAGVYADSRFNLTYAAKDAKDIGVMFSADTSFAHVYKYVLTDAEVTRENIEALKDSLKSARRDDMVLLFYAGHGVLDEQYNYYLASHRMDFQSPGKTGIPYEEIENLVDCIAPLKKIILIDACHSGEVDKEEVQQLAMHTQVASDITFRSAGAGIARKTLGLKTTSELMNEMFTDLRRGTGATVISSAGGFELAMESDQWKNGLFTYTLLEGLKSGDADTDEDGAVMLSELQQYLRTEVTRLSNGTQQPTSRSQNLTLNFKVW